MKKETFDLAGYQAQADGWEDDRLASMRKQRNIANGMAVAGSAIAFCACAALVMMFPLKTSEPYLLEHNTATGEIKQLTSLRANAEGVRSLSEDDSVVSSFLVPYVVARETYDKADFAVRAETVQIFSDSRVYSAYDATHRSDSATENPFRKYGNDRVAVTVTRVAFLNKSTAQVAFSTKWFQQVGTVNGSYVATITFAFANTPSELAVRWRNPLGFRVTGYRVDQEILNG